MNSNIEKYQALMQEIKERFIFTGAVCNHIYCGQEPLRAMDIETCCLQIRKMLELVAMGSLVVNKEAFERIGKSFENMWHAKNTLREIKRINSSYLPRPINETLQGKDNDIIEYVDGDILTEKTIEKILDKCGKILHAPNPFGTNIDYQYYVAHIPSWLDYILNTLKTHIIFFPERKGALVIEFNEPNSPITSTTLLSFEEYQRLQKSKD